MSSVVLSVAKKWAFSAILVAGFLFLGKAPRADAVTACPEEFDDNIEIDFPVTVALGREVYGSLSANYDYSDLKWIPPQRLDVALTPVGSTEPEWTRDWSSSTTFWMTFRTPGNYDLTARGTFTKSNQSCDVLATRRITATRGLYVRPKIRPGIASLNNGAEITWNCPGSNVNRINGDPISITIQDAFSFKEMTIGEGCEVRGDAKPSILRTSNWSARRAYSRGIDLVFKKNRYPFKVTVIISQGGENLRMATFKVRWISRPARKIWIGSDAFINFCINKFRPIRSENGKLYCKTYNTSYNLVKYIRRY